MSWYPEAQGSYEIMAYASDGWPIYKKINDSTVMFYENSIPAWLVSDKTSSLIAPKILLSSAIVHKILSLIIHENCYHNTKSSPLSRGFRE